MEQILPPLVAALTAALSTYGIMRGQNISRKQHNSSNNTQQIQTIFDGYSRIVADLHAEVQRLHIIVDGLHKEQEACEERNNLLEKEIEELVGRLCRLEEGTNGQQR